jgi:hypothetical protein
MSAAQNVLQTALVGTERQPLAEHSLRALGLSPDADPVVQALEALALCGLKQKAGLQLPPAPPMPDPDAQPPGKVLPAEALHLLGPLLQNSANAEGLAEFAALLAGRGLSLPPVALPELLDKGLTEPGLREQVRVLMGTRGQWLAQQHPRWRDLLLPAPSEWALSGFAQRLELLRATRPRNPLLTNAWLSEAWHTEPPEHKVQLLATLQPRLSELDGPLLETAFGDRSPEVRRMALHLWVQLPDAAILAPMSAFFAQNLAGAWQPATRERHLKDQMPELAPDALQPWIGLLPKAAMSDWRNGLLVLFARFLPPERWLAHCAATPAALLEALDGGNRSELLEAFLENLQRRADPAWVGAVLRHCTANSRHPIWQSQAMQGFLTRYADQVFAHVEEQGMVLDFEQERLLRALENFPAPWPERLLGQLLAQYRYSVEGRSNLPEWHFGLALRMAAWRCRVDDGLRHGDMLLPSGSGHAPRSWGEFQDVLRLRQRIHALARSVAEATSQGPSSP